MKIQDALAGSMPHDELRGFSGRFDVVGDIAILTIPPALQKYDHVIADAILKHRHGIRTVVNKSSHITGDFVPLITRS